MRSFFSRLFGLRRRRKLPDEPLYFSRLRHRSDDEWRAALAQSPVEAARWVYAAACNGEVQAVLVWGQMLLDGRGTRRDPPAALRWFRIAADAGSADGINMVGRCHERGWGTAADPAEAARWFARAVETGHAQGHDQGHAWAQFNLGMLMLTGEGVPADPRGALSLFVRAARQGHAKAMSAIGQMRERGEAGLANPRSAARWYRRAAERGCFRGAFHTGRLLLAAGRTGEAVPWLAAAIEAAPADVCRATADSLLEQPEPEIRAIGRRALARAGEAPAVP